MTRSRSGDPDPDDAADWDDRSSRTWPWVVAPAILVVPVVLIAGWFVFVDIGCGCQPSTPQPVIDIEQDGESVVLTHEGGDTLNEENTGSLVVTVDGEDHRSIALPFTGKDTVVVEGVEPGQRVRVVWADPGGGSRQTLASYQMPEHD